MIAENGTLYGTMNFEGAYGYGTAFALDPNTDVEKILHSFGSGLDGFYLTARQIDVKDMLYGTTKSGDLPPGCGTVFTIDAATGKEMVLHAFCPEGNCADGTMPEAGLIDVNGKLYGTTLFGGDSSQSSEFEIMP